MTDPQLVERLYERLLVLRCQTGDEAAFTELVARYTPRLRIYLRQMLAAAAGGAHTADDALQDVWLDCFRSVGRLQDAGAFAAWLYRIARDRAYRILRRRGALRMSPMEDANDVAAAAAAAATAAATDDDVDAALDGEGTTAERLIHASLDRLPHPQREVLLLRFVEEMSYEQIAASVGCNVGTVRSRLHYAKRALRREIERTNHP